MNYEQRKLIKQKIDEIKRARLDKLVTNREHKLARRIRCKGVTFSGERCGAWAFAGEEYCKSHLDQKS